MHPLSPPAPPMLLPPMNTTCTDASAAVARKISTARALVKVERHVVKNQEKSTMKAMRHVCVGIYARAKIAIVGRRDAKMTRKLLIDRSTTLSENSDVPNWDGGCVESHEVSVNLVERGRETEDDVLRLLLTFIHLPNRLCAYQTSNLERTNLEKASSSSPKCESCTRSLVLQLHGKCSGSCKKPPPPSAMINQSWRSARSLFGGSFRLYNFSCSNKASSVAKAVST